VTQKKGDDYPARIYITFEYDPDKLSFFEKTKYQAARLIYGQYPPHAAINYIWESKAPRETIVPNPYTDRVKMIVVESGDEYAGVWREEQRNIYEDYKKAFGEEPPMISGVAIMTDSDNTGGIRCCLLWRYSFFENISMIDFGRQIEGENRLVRNTTNGYEIR
jgi:hypothetical protein